jgi:hypothetical protein
MGIKSSPSTDTLDKDRTGLYIVVPQRPARGPVSGHDSTGHPIICLFSKLVLFVKRSFLLWIVVKGRMHELIYSHEEILLAL